MVDYKLHGWVKMFPDTIAIIIFTVVTVQRVAEKCVFEVALPSMNCCWNTLCTIGKPSELRQFRLLYGGKNENRFHVEDEKIRPD